MTFQSKDSLALHKKSRHYTGFLYFGKSDE